MIKKVYNSCMDEEGLKSAANRPLRAILKHLGGWPVIQVRRWNSAKFDWIDTLIKIRNLGYNHDIFISLSVTMDNENNTANIIKLGKPSFGMDSRYLLRGVTDKSVRDYVLSMEKSADELGAYNLPKSPIYKAFEFEVMLANISLQNEKENVSIINRKYTVKDLKTLVPQINWDKYFNGLLSNGVSDNDIVLVEDLTFIENVAHFIIKTHKRVLANYMIWRVIDQSMSFMSKRWRSLKYSPRHSLETKRWEVCLSFIRDNLGIALSSYYVRNYVQEENYDTVQEYVDYIRENFVRILENTEWMDDDTKEIAKAKVKSITSHIGYAKELLNASYISDLYKNLNIDNTSYFDIRRKIFKWSTDYSFSLLRKPNMKGRWNKHSRTTVIQAFYDERQNSIGIPTGVLQAPIFYNNRPHYLNFGSLGYIIGHEITHAFDNRGRIFDKDGNSRNWWSTTEEQAFNSRAECFIEQYDNYTAENGMQVKGMNTQDENIADGIALKAAYLAYQSWVKDHKREQKLPGLDYTPNQLFWIQAANIWCEKLQPETLRNIITYAPYSPSKFRVIGPMSNLPEFAKDFQCNVTSEMVRKNKCQVW
ncbi:neprilysin-2-like [Stegodyphus dumicola]|uniref:neprilysin-2-like n=1 Tax=Stegodyphus dumicola TaxID=202533 RepID=UPI0015A92159|nr:neprilysin-2-like [Stegodyphus dumicola]